MPFPSGRRGVVGVVVETARALGAAEESTALKAKVVQPGGKKLRAIAVVAPELCTQAHDALRIVFAPEVIGIHEGLLAVNGRAVNQRFSLPVTALPRPGDLPAWASGMEQALDVLQRAETSSLELLQDTKMDRIRDWSKRVSADGPASSHDPPIVVAPNDAAPLSDNASRREQEKEARRRLRQAQQAAPLSTLTSVVPEEPDNADSDHGDEGSHKVQRTSPSRWSSSFAAMKKNQSAVPRPRSADAGPTVAPRLTGTGAGAGAGAGSGVAARHHSDSRVQRAPLASGSMCCLCYAEVGASSAYSLSADTYCANDFRALFLKPRKRAALVGKLLSEGRAGFVAALPDVSLQGLKLRDVHVAQAAFRRTPSHHKGVALRKDCVALYQGLLEALLKSGDVPSLVDIMREVNSALPERQPVVSELDFLVVLARLADENRSSFSTRVSTRLRSLRKGRKEAEDDGTLAAHARRSGAALAGTAEQPYSRFSLSAPSPAAGQWMMY